MGRKPLSDEPMTPAQRQARRRLRVKEQPRWEYRIERIVYDEEADELGAEGWELVAVTDMTRAYFKRRVLTNT